MPSLNLEQKIQKRINGLFLLEKKLGHQLNMLLNEYKTQYFLDSSLNKKVFFEECLYQNLSSTSKNFLIRKCSFSYHKDSRTSVEYGIDLAIGWLAEDLILHYLRSQGINIVTQGSDKKREFLFYDEIKTDADFLCQSPKGPIHIEFVISWDSHWHRLNKIDLRDSKYRHLVRQPQDQYLLGVELPEVNGFLIHMELEKDNFKSRRNAAWGNKLVYTFYGIRGQLKPLDKIISKIKNLS